MCETRNANRSTRNEDGDEDGEEEATPRRRPRRQNNRRTVRPRGSGPREGGGNDEWVLTRRRPGNNRRGQQTQ